MFGSVTPQPESSTPNGYLALGVFDTADYGGDESDAIDQNDWIYNKLRLWRDANQDGVSQSTELTTLGSQDVRSISILYSDQYKTEDQHGNFFQFLSSAEVDEEVVETYDVFLQYSDE
jgi:hypothetical protein